MRFTAFLLLLLASLPCLAAGRAIPAPLADHPGNVFLVGENIGVPLPVAEPVAWRVTDYDGRTVAEGRSTAGQAGPGGAAASRAEIGSLPIGWYEVRWGEGDAPERRRALAVLQPLAAPTPGNSPIGLDVAMAWFYKGEQQMTAAANLCTLAGVNWVRDRLTWGEMERQRGQFTAAPTKYDDSARIQSAAGLKVLQVNHSSPGWANPDHKRFPLDLRDAYRFHREMARRWAGQVTAFEPWNEADIDAFGGHTGAEMASMQKASYLGLKAGNPEVTACLNVFATPRWRILADLAANRAWPYFDTFNLHHYAETDEYPAIYDWYRQVSAGRPLWTTEFSMPVPWAGDEKRKEPTEADLRQQAERVAKAFAASLHEGTRAAFYFLLPHYTEGQTQFGVLRPDLTPRPAYVALAAVGRLLAAAKPVGRLKGGPANVRAYVFRAWPGDVGSEILIAWTTDGKADLPLPASPAAVFDHLGRPQEMRGPALALTPAPILAAFAPGTTATMTLSPPLKASPHAEGQPSPLVLQAIWPKERTDLSRSAYRVTAGKAEKVPVFIYNFSATPVEGTLRVSGPAEWRPSIAPSVKVEPEGRAELTLTVEPPARASGDELGTIHIGGDFGRAGRTGLSLWLVAEAAK